MYGSNVHPLKRPKLTIENTSQNEMASVSNMSCVSMEYGKLLSDDKPASDPVLLKRNRNRSPTDHLKVTNHSLEFLNLHNILFFPRILCNQLTENANKIFLVRSKRLTA